MAALIDALDLVISIDTGAAHLAAALGANLGAAARSRRLALRHQRQKPARVAHHAPVQARITRGAGEPVLARSVSEALRAANVVQSRSTQTDTADHLNFAQQFFPRSW